MNAGSRVTNALFLAVDEVNRLQPQDQQLPKDADAALIGSQSPLSSLGLVNFVVAAEEKIDEEFQQTVPLTELVSTQDQTHFQTIGSLSEFVAGLLRDGTPVT